MTTQIFAICRYLLVPPVKKKYPNPVLKVAARSSLLEHGSSKIPLCLCPDLQLFREYYLHDLISLESPANTIHTAFLFRFSKENKQNQGSEVTC